MEKTSDSKSFLSIQTLVLIEVAWAVLALLFFLLFSVPLPGQGRPVWYAIGTSVFEAGAYLAAALLCFRNWRSPQIVSGRNVWLSIGTGMLCYFLGNLLFAYWETGLGQEAAVSPGDFFFVLTYIFLILGMVSAVVTRRLNLEIWQWGVVAGIAAIGIVLAWLISSPAPSSSAESFLMQPAMAQTAPATQPSPKTTPKPANVKPNTPQKPPVSASPASPSAEKKPEKAPGKQKGDGSNQKPTPPEWAVDLEKQLAWLGPPINLFYIVSDVLLLIIATTLLLAFWGGRFAQSWRMIAAAAFSLYIADMWFKYATSRIPDYQSGGLLEVFWVFSGVLFGIGAALEYDLSSRSRSRAGSRRRGS